MTAAIILAAGKSRRMGTQKLLLPFRGRPLIAHVAREILLAKLDLVVVVVCQDWASIVEALDGLPVTPVINPLPGGDMLSSVRCGLRALPAECSRFLLVLGDQPGITAELVARLIAAADLARKPIVVPVCQGRRGHPVLISTSFRDEILTRHDGAGLRSLLHGHPGDIAEIPVEDPAALEDMDSPEDYVRLSRVDTGSMMC